ncbi:LysR family transcriptional regulator, partial [Rhizobium ruizarguesonis]
MFRAVVDHKSFLGAQIALGLSQSAVSFHIKALEDRLGFKLCQRGRSVFELTDRGTGRIKAVINSLP